MKKKEVLSTLVSDILIRDIFMRYNLRNHDVYRRMLQYLLSNTGKEVSFNNLKNTKVKRNVISFTGLIIMNLQSFRFQGRSDHRMKRERWKASVKPWIILTFQKEPSLLLNRKTNLPLKERPFAWYRPGNGFEELCLLL